MTIQNPHNLRKDAYHMLDQADAIVRTAVKECRGLTVSEEAEAVRLKTEGMVMLDRAEQFLAALVD